MKCLISLLLVIIIIPSVLALDLTIEQVSSNSTIIEEINNPVIFNLKITNNNKTDNFKIYNLLGFDILPREKFKIEQNETKEVQLTVYVRDDLDIEGHYSFYYYIQAEDSSEIQDTLTIKMIKLGETFQIGTGEIYPDSNSIEIFIKNKEDINFENINTKFSSQFFEFEKNFSLAPKQKKEFKIPLDSKDFKKLTAGFYTLSAEVQTQGQEAELETTINFKEKDLLITEKKDSGLIISTKIIIKENKGNTIKITETQIKKNIISRLFTSFTPEPDIVERKAATITYTWNQQIKPGESYEIIVKTNWLFPFITILLIAVIVIGVKQYTKTDLVLRKRVSFVKTKGGEFALKVSIFVQAKKYLERVTLIDYLPPLVKIYEKFGIEKPTRIDMQKRRIEWNFEKLEPGENRLVHYIIYSKVGIMGKFELPSAKAIYDREGKIKESHSNKAFFVTEQRTKDIEE